MTETLLQACPFCMGGATWSYRHGYQSGVQCQPGGCGAYVTFDAVVPLSAEQIAAKWNERPLLARLRANFLADCEMIGYSEEESRQMLQEVEDGQST